MERLCIHILTCLIADEVRSSFSRSGTFLLFKIRPSSPISLLWPRAWVTDSPWDYSNSPDLKAQYGLLELPSEGILACRAALAVLDVLKRDKLQEHAGQMEQYFREKAAQIPG